jgi:hypothetical protein
MNTRSRGKSRPRDEAKPGDRNLFGQDAKELLALDAAAPAASHQDRRVTRGRVTRCLRPEAETLAEKKEWSPRASGKRRLPPKSPPRAREH